MLTLWGPLAIDFKYEPGQIVGFKYVKVSDFGGKSINCSEDSILVFEPQHPRTQIIQKWYDDTKNKKDLI